MNEFQSILSIIVAALSIGFMGSFHCVGMCGPLALALPVQHLQGGFKFFGIVLYNFGRALTYALIGLCLGWIGMQFFLFGWQQVLSLVLGGLLLIAFLASLNKKRLLQNNGLQRFWNKFILPLLSKLMKQRKLSALLWMGMLNGLLPCGLVYLGLAAAVATGNVWKSTLFMAVFGLGTMPAMFAVSYAGNMINLKWRNKMKAAVPYVVGIMGLLLVLRGMNLNIPYLSPQLGNEQVECCHK